MIQLRVCDSPSWIGFGRWANTECAGFTTVLTGERSKSRPTTKISLFSEKTQWLPSVFTHKKVESRNTFRQRRQFLRTSTSSRKNETLFRFSAPEEAARQVLEEQRDHLLAETKSEILKQECKVDTLHTCILVFRRQAHSNRLEMDYVNYGYEETRREEARLHEDLAQREKALRDTRIRNIHEVEEMKRAQEMRIGEFSRNELRESHASFQEITSQIQESQERINYMSDSGEFQDVESICSGKLSHVPSQPAFVPSLCGMLSRDQSLRPDTWNLLGTPGNVFDSPRAVINSPSTPCQWTLHSWN